MKSHRCKILNGLLILTSLVGYLEWGRNNHQFLVQAEFEVIAKLFSDLHSVWHPFILLPMFGQLILLITIFQTSPSRFLSIIGIACLGILIGFMFIIGLLGLHLKIIISTIPFVTLAIMALLFCKRPLST